MTLWQRFGVWRRSRPFWGGLLAVLAGLEIIASTKMTLDGASISVGAVGFQALLIPFMLVVAGLLAWYTPAQRHFYGLIATFVAIYSLIAVNLGGWFLGTLLGVAGGGLIFAWNPAEPTKVADEDLLDGDDDGNEAGDGDDDRDTHVHAYGAAYDQPGTRVDDLLDGPMTDTLPPPVNPLRGSVPNQRQPADDTHDDRAQTPRHAAMMLIGLALSASLLTVVAAQGTARAEGCTPVAPAAAQPGPVRQVVDGVFDALGRLINGGTAPAPAVTPSVSPSPSAEPTPCPTPSDDPKPSPTASHEPTGSPAPSTSVSPTGSVRPSGSSGPTAPATPSVPAKRIEASAGQLAVAERPSRMTGTKITMYNLVFEGITTLPTGDGGTIEVLQFSMTQSDTEDFNLHVYGANGTATDLSSSKLTVSGPAVKFYTNRFQGKLGGLLDVDYTPKSPPPPVPFDKIVFTEPDIQLVFVDSPILNAPNLKITQTKA